MSLRKTLRLVHNLLEQGKIDHMLIGGFGLACYGSTRATSDVDILVHEDSKTKARGLLENIGFNIVNLSDEVMQFSGVGNLDILIARRPISQEMLIRSIDGGPEGIKFARAEDLIGLKIQAYKNDSEREFQDKADIQFLIRNVKDLDFELIKKYADLFDEWSFIDEIKKKN
jgi:predicted nucleotidyltransferase